MKHSAQRQLLMLFALSSLSAFSSASASAQIVPDDTLGIEQSVVVPDVLVNGLPADQIEGGALRGELLFHSFLDFNISEGRGVYFANPAAVDTIFSRITGANPSDILGTLGVLGDADLVFLNPNGILFGPNARLDLRGSFTGSTASGMELSNGEVFSVLAPEVPSLLTLNTEAPIGLVFEGANTQAITSEGILFAPEDLTLAAADLNLQGQLYAGQDLVLQAQDTVQIRDSGQSTFIAASGDQLTVQGDQAIDISALNHLESGLFSGGDMTLRSNNPVSGDAHYWSGGSFQIETLDGTIGDLLSPVDPIIRAFGDVRIGVYVGSSLHILAGGAVDIGTAIITAPDIGTEGVDFLQETIELSDGTFVEVDGDDQPTLDVRAGLAPATFMTPVMDILTGFDPETDAFFGEAFVTETPTNANITVGDVFVNAPNGLVLLTSQYRPNPIIEEGSIFVTGEGIFRQGINVLGLPEFDRQGGEVYIDARSDVSIINSSIDTSGAGNVGDIVINAGETVRFEAQNRRTIAASNLRTGEEGVGGEVRITANTLEVLNGAQLAAITFGIGDAGNVVITARDLVRFEGRSADGQFASAALSRVDGSAIGQGGNVKVTADSVEVLNGALLSASTFGDGDAGNVVLNARDRVIFDDGNAFSRVNAGAIGAGGNVVINANSLEVSNTGQLTAATLGNGNAGNVEITTGNRVVFNGGDAFSGVNEGAIGMGGNLEITTNTLEMLNGSQLSASTSGIGDAGNLVITALGHVLFDDDASATTSVEEEGRGTGGNVEIVASSLEVLNGSQLLTDTLGNGNAGNVLISAHDLVIFGDRGSAFSRVNTGATGMGGDVVVNSKIVKVQNRAQLLADTSSQGNAGNVVINAHDLVIFDNRGSAFSRVNIGATGRGGNVVITTDTLEVINGAQLLADTAGNGDAGSVIIRATEQVNLQGASSIGRSSAIATNSQFFATGQANDIHITTPTLQVQDGAALFAGTVNARSGGDIILSLDRLRVIDGGQIVTTSLGSGAAGTINIDATEGIQILGSDSTFAARGIQVPGIRLLYAPQSRLSVQSRETGSAGDIIVGAAGTTPSVFLDDGGQIIAESAAVDGGNITLSLTGSLLLRNGSLISATAGTSEAGGDGGNIFIDSGSIFAVAEENSDITANAFEGNGGLVTVNADGIFGIEFRDQLTPFSDITASSELGNPGVVNINTPNVDPNQGLSALPEEPREVEIVDRCQGETVQNSISFFDLGQGGAPPGPDSLHRSSAAAPAWLSFERVELPLHSRSHNYLVADDEAAFSETAVFPEQVWQSSEFLPPDASSQLRVTCHAN